MSFKGPDTRRDFADEDGPRAPKRQRLRDGMFTDDSASNTFSHSDYTIGWICALSIEMAAAVAMLDSKHQPLPRAENDTNTYILGSIAAHNVVIACLPSGRYGNNSAATVASDMSRTFPAARLCLMVGIGGGVPDKTDIRLGDVVVSESIIQYDLGKLVSDGRLMRTRSMSQPPPELLTAVNTLRAEHERGPSQIPSILSEMLKRYPDMTQYIYHDSLRDRLFQSTYDHVPSTDKHDCELCDESRLVKRSPRDNSNTKIHYGTIASGNQVMRYGKTRSELAHELDALCFEMEGAGVMDRFAALVIRGICDYSDSHKNKQWQKVAAAVAAAYTKELLLVLPSTTCKTAPMVAMPATDADRQNKILDSLKFDQIDSRRSNIKPKYSTTCQWLLTHPDYLGWLDPTQAGQHHGFLWIRGGPGTGKSTIMNFAYEKARMDRKNMTISFFFNARGESLERSTPGMYRSLLLQLLKALPNLRRVLDEPDYSEYLDEIYATTLREQQPVWNLKILQDLLKSALAKIGQNRLTIFVDALDECALEQVEELVEYFEDLGEDAVTTDSRLNICFSSRYYPHIDIQYGLKIDLERQDGHEEDIAMYIRNKLKIGNSKTAQDVKTQIQTKAKGIFMWVFLVVPILKAEYRGGRIFEVKKRLASLPAKLSELFGEILSRDQINLGDLRLCIQWILFAKRPLKLEEYYFAAVSGLSPDGLQEWDPEEVTTDDMSRFVISSSKGLAETTKSKVRTVQFIHESVREFFLKDGLQQLWPNLSMADFESTSHGLLSQCCYVYFLSIASRITGYLHIPESLPKASSDEAKQLRDAVSGKFPFLAYAICHILYHANEAASMLSQQEFLISFPITAWISLSNVFEIYTLHRHTLNASLLYILAEKGFAKLITSVLRLNPRIEIEGERYQYPLFAAMANSHQDAIKALLETETGHLPDEALTKLNYGPNFKVKKGQTPLLWAASEGHEDFARLLLEKGSDIKARDKDGMTPLLYAARNGNTATVRLLLEMGSDIETKDKDKMTPLLHAADYGHTATVRLLLETGSDTEAESRSGRTLMSYAAENGHEAILRLLLETGSDIEAKDSGDMTPLLRAARHGHTAAVRLLLEIGSDIEAKCGFDQTPLVCAAQHGHEAIVRLLLEGGADLTVSDIDGFTSLSAAAMNGHEAIVQLLLERGADLTVRSTFGWTPLLAAVMKGREAIVRLLLERGSDVTARDKAGRTPLSRAVYNGHESIVRLLLDKGGDGVIKAIDDSGLLPTAAYLGNGVIVRLLLEKGADINAKDVFGRTALDLAIANGHEDTVRVLHWHQSEVIEA